MFLRMRRKLLLLLFVAALCALTVASDGEESDGRGNIPEIAGEDYVKLGPCHDASETEIKVEQGDLRQPEHLLSKALEMYGQSTFRSGLL
ncbi:hypothetical protein P5673_025370 [Acropora cervicornis]|uniref:Uncharacterized protein n=1 Tax=Acropora cervicornis TaxID=6130 RepID=A0AAD9Q285_ACRCE|nr:hypothetical protein P5673_025370 [Acropora cervicornis]